jgi:3-methyladenine DNA glycosylase/8-oxoguanine DNA glycosylase
MNQRLCEVLGERSASGLRAFPTPERLSRARAANLRARCRVGYRDQRIIDLAKLFASARKRLASGKPLGADHLALPEWESCVGPDGRPRDRMSDADVREVLLDLPGIGPYAAANIMQLLGRYAHLPLDSESVRHGRTVLKLSGTSASIMKRVGAHFEPFGEQRFRSYWFELWRFYESKRGPAWMWERETTGKTFTASQLAD